MMPIDDQVMGTTGTATRTYRPGSARPIRIRQDDVQIEFEPGDVIRIGSHPACLICVMGPTISPIHATLFVADDGKWTLVNVGYGGTALDGERVERAKITGPSVVRLGKGDAELVIEPAPDV